MENDSKNKYDFLNLLLRDGDVMLCLDASRSDVDVPPAHKENPSLNLILNLNFRRPIEVRPEGIFVTLSFSGRPHSCVIPFEAVWAIYEPSMKKGQVWESSIPESLNMMDQALNQSPSKLTKKLEMVKSKAKTNHASKPPRSGKKKDRSHLRVIK